MIEEFRTFVAIARCGTFTQAADWVALSPAAVSGHVKRLEDHLGVLLFDRTGRSATLNDDGARLLPKIQHILDLVDGLLDPEMESAAGSLRVGAIGSVQSAMLGRALSRFRQEFPKVGVHVVPGLSMHLIDQVDGGEMDLAVLVRPPFALPLELSWQPLRREPYVLIAPPSVKGGKWTDVIQAHPFIGYHRLSFGGRHVNRFLRKLPFTIKHAAEIPLQAMLSGVRDGVGVALVPLSEAPLPDDISIYSLEGEDLYREIGIVRSQIARPDRATSHLIDCLVWAAEQAQDAA